MTDLTLPTLEDIIADLEISEAEAAVGQSVPLAPILKRLHERAERLEAKAALEARQRAASRS